MIFADMHTHTRYSHGECSPREAALAAAAAGITHIAISEHSYANMFYGLKREDFKRLFTEIDALNREFKPQGVNVLKGVELNLLGEGRVDIPEGLDFDVVILGYHRGVFPKNSFLRRALGEAFGFGSDAKRNTLQFIRAMEENPIDIIAHPGEYISVDIRALAYAAARTNTLIEINNRHVTLNPDDLRIAADCGARFIINSDAHKRTEFCEYKNAVNAALKAGVLDVTVNWK